MKQESNVIPKTITPARKEDIIIFNNADRITRLKYRFDSYRKIVWHSLRKKVPPVDLIRTQFPFILPDAAAPPILGLELTNICNIRCVYCTGTLGLRKRGYMSGETFARLVESVREFGINRIKITGNGEPTLHPEFTSFIGKLARVTKFLQVLSNGQWTEDETAAAMLKAPVDIIGISVDSNNKEGYEKSRVGGKFDRLLYNLRRLAELRKKLKAHSMIKIRLMLRPSEKNREKQMIEFWKSYADAVMPQYIYKRKRLDYDEDVYFPLHQQNDSYPKCTFPFKAMMVDWSGDVPLCSGSASQIGPPGLILGNLNENSLKNIWNGPTMRQYRYGHRKRDLTKIPICKGCPGV